MRAPGIQGVGLAFGTNNVIERAGRFNRPDIQAKIDEQRGKDQEALAVFFTQEERASLDYFRIPGSTNVYAFSAAKTNTPVEVATGPLTTKAIQLQYKTTDVVEPMVSLKLLDGERVTPFPTRNMIVVQATAPTHAVVSNIIRLVDVPRK